MANLGGQCGWDDVTVIGKRGPRSGTTLKSQAVTNLKFNFRNK
jgi:predicted secreted Zn-dependent protease